MGHEDYIRLHKIFYLLVQVNVGKTFNARNDNISTSISKYSVNKSV